MSVEYVKGVDHHGSVGVQLVIIAGRGGRTNTKSTGGGRYCSLAVISIG